MVILGIDPGIALVGYGVIDYDGNRIRCLEYGVIETSSELTTPQRLTIIDQEMNRLFDSFRPDDVAFEELFFYQNKTNGILVAQARGVEVLAAAKRSIPIFEYTPSQIKQTITGYGRANKLQMQRSVQTLLRLSVLPTPDDAADGLAVAICHAFAQRFKEENLLR
ncbi:MAG: crossover junction endodeoxyribonuclease RuvC [Peptoniphilaceae bacterium]|nr:crossover junction endodeoxyribonuclease RuvC [Peptoniphilaceae bacterium]MDY5765951.1 crossover junction endodeoxyribonuclease RuvC [Peptoniphilaceae bacterium]